MRLTLLRRGRALAAWIGHQRLLLLLGGLTLACASALAGTPASHAALEHDALEPVHAFFDAMARHDQAAMRARVLPAGTATLMREGKPVQLTLGDFVDGVKPGKERIEERIGTPQVLVDHDLAMVWAPYTFLRDGKSRHCGTDVFNLVRVEGSGGSRPSPTTAASAYPGHLELIPAPCRAACGNVASPGPRWAATGAPRDQPRCVQRACFSAERSSPASLSSTPLT